MPVSHLRIWWCADVGGKQLTLVQIGDLLKSITGSEGSSPASAPSISRTNTLPKRKADEDLQDIVSKAPRTTGLSTVIGPRPMPSLPRSRPGDGNAPVPRPSQPSRPLDRQNATQRPYNGTSSKPSVLSARPMNGSNRVTKPGPPNRPSPGPSNASRVAPKKGSFAEILARGQRAQQVMGQVGKIQHKKVEKGAVKKEEEKPKVDVRPGLKQKQPAAPSGYTGTSKPGAVKPGLKPLPRNGPSSNGHARDGRNDKGAPPLTKAERAKAAAEEEKEKKVKKAAAATTGYTGTARPKPGGGTAKKRDAPRGGALLNTRAPRPSSSKSRFDDEYDEDMDDFIDYDDEEAEGYDQGPRYDYDSDASSDMEAGLDDIDGEERRAERIARQEDIAEERLEKSLKAAKEDRKRKALEALRAGRRR